MHVPCSDVGRVDTSDFVFIPSASTAKSSLLTIDSLLSVNGLFEI